MKFRESTHKAMLQQRLGRETNFENPYQQNTSDASKSYVAKIRNRNENYLAEDFMDNLIAKIKKREQNKASRDTMKFDNPQQVAPPRLCVDFKFLAEQIQQETSAELRSAKTKAEEDGNRHSSNIHATRAQNQKRRPKVSEQDISPALKDGEDVSTPTKEGIIVVKKINKTIEIKQKEHDEMRNQFLKLIQGD